MIMSRKAYLKMLKKCLLKYSRVLGGGESPFYYYNYSLVDFFM